MGRENPVIPLSHPQSREVKTNIGLIHIRFPVKLGYDLSGTIVAVGDSVTEFKIGDEVFSCLPWDDRGTYQMHVPSTINQLRPR
jgi:NADPH:quinone reductase-like Zn-dependent oxidoreductase